MGNSKIARVIVTGESEGMGEVYKYVWREEQVAIENLIEKKEFRLRPRGRQRRELVVERRKT